MRKFYDLWIFKIGIIYRYLELGRKLYESEFQILLHATRRTLEAFSFIY